MGDQDLAKLRQQRLNELQSQHGRTLDVDRDKMKAQEERTKALNDAKESILTQVLSQDARARLNTIKLSKPEKGALVENMVCKMVHTGQFTHKISEQELIQFIESINQQLPKSTNTVKFDRRRAALDSDDDDF